MSKDIEKKNNVNNEAEGKQEQYSLNDDRRVKVLSPGAMVAKRFFRNRIAVVGLVILAFMFLFSFVGGLITPYREDQQFYKIETQNKDYAGATLNEEFRYLRGYENIDSVLNGFNRRFTSLPVILENSAEKCLGSWAMTTPLLHASSPVFTM